MGEVKGLLGLGGGAAGTGFAGPSSANILNPTTAAQAGTTYDTAQNALSQQQAFANAAAAQNGLGNQSSVFNQLQGVANGTGPNPAQAQLAQATGANTANQAALMAGQRGSNANVGLIARQAAMQGAANQQNSIGQAANLQANQSLQALSGLGSIAGQQVGQQQQAVSGLNTAAQGEQQNVLNAIAGQNNANVGMQSNVNNVNGQLANTTMQGQQAGIGGLFNSAGGIASSVGKLFSAEGGKVPRQHYADPQGPVQAGSYDSNFKGLNNDQWNAGAVNPSTLPPPGPSTPPIPQIAPPGPAVPAGTVPPTLAANPAAPAAGAPVANKSSAPNKPGVAVAPIQQDSQPNFGNPGANALYQGLSSFGKYLSDKSSGDTTTKSPKGEYDASGFSADQLSTERARLDAQEAGGLPSTDPLQSNFGYDNKTDVMKASNSDPMEVHAKGGEVGNKKVPAMVSPGERYLPPKEVAAVKAGKKSPMEAGEKIPGKPKVGGAKNDYANDTVPKTLEEGGLVLPRSVTQSKSPHWAAMRFVQEHMAQGGKVLPAKPKAKK